MGKKTEQDKPSRRMVETLLKELASSCNGWTTSELEAMEKDIDRMSNRRLDYAPLNVLKANLEKARDKHDAGRKSRLEKVNKIRRKYLSRGAVPSVLKSLQQLVAEFNRSRL